MAVSPPPPGTALDRTFRVSITLKGLDGILEIIGGALLLFISPSAIYGVARVLTQHELSEDPGDFFASWLLHAAGSLTVSASLFGAIYLLAHGLVKVVLVVAVLRNRLWAYPWHPENPRRDQTDRRGLHRRTSTDPVMTGPLGEGPLCNGLSSISPSYLNSRWNHRP